MSVYVYNIYIILYINNQFISRIYLFLEFLHEKNDLIKIPKNLAKYRSKNNLLLDYQNN